ncbi:unnamed protein product [Rotaria sordida]|uniref:Integrase catalytic domain-containing protein n=1 Tax=Rotaria sordida TaxID=392033 RepID=A0A819VLL8_9BILA|nr:unnamed protein product [Rotaria sordida]
MDSDLTVVEENINMKYFYDKVDEYINSLDQKFRGKAVIAQELYKKIQQCLLLPKGTSSNLFSTNFTYWVKHKFVLIKIAAIDVVACIKTKKPVCIYENFYNAINEAHTNISHGGREKTMYELNCQYSYIPRPAVEIFLKQCVPCQTRKPVKHHVITKPIIALGVMTRLQIDLIDFRTRADKISSDLIYCWILNCIDHFSKYTWTFPLRNKSAVEVAEKLRQLFFTFGPPHILYSDNGREFISSVITELKVLFPDVVFIRGRPRHPQSQGCIERANGVLCDALGKWMCANGSSSWSSALLPVTYEINTRISTVTKTSPYQIVFGQATRSDSDFWKIVRANGIENEEDLPTPVAESNDDLNINQGGNWINLDEGTDGETITLVNKLSNDAPSSSINS